MPARREVRPSAANCKILNARNKAEICVKGDNNLHADPNAAFERTPRMNLRPFLGRERNGSFFKFLLKTGVSAFGPKTDVE